MDPLLCKTQLKIGRISRQTKSVSHYKAFFFGANYGQVRFRMSHLWFRYNFLLLNTIFYYEQISRKISKLFYACKVSLNGIRTDKHKHISKRTLLLGYKVYLLRHFQSPLSPKKVFSAKPVAHLDFEEAVS